jgi:hypothetical protein
MGEIYRGSRKHTCQVVKEGQDPDGITGPRRKAMPQTRLRCCKPNRRDGKLGWDSERG